MKLPKIKPEDIFITIFFLVWLAICIGLVGLVGAYSGWW